MNLSVRSLLIAGGTAVIAWLPAVAATNTLSIPFYRGNTGAESAGWDHFTVATDNGIGNSPDLGGNAAAHLIQLDPNAAVLGSGNIYNQAGLSRFEIRDTANAPVGFVDFNVRTLGSELDYNSIRLTYDIGAGLQEISAPRLELERVTFGPPGPGGGAAVTSLVEWNLSGLGVSSFAIKFNAADVSVSLDSATIDTLSASQTALVPEPQTWALLAAGTALLATAAWRRR